MTYTCTVTQGFTLSWTAAPVVVNPSLVRFTTSDSAGRMLGCSDIHAIQCADFDLQSNLTRIGPDMSGARARHDFYFQLHCQSWAQWNSGGSALV